MSSASRAGVPEPHGPTDPEAIKADIEATREELSRTVDELSARLDVPARAKEKMEHARERILDSYLQNQAIVVATAGLAMVLLLGSVVRRRRKRARARRDS